MKKININKKAAIRTIEVMIAVTLTLIFITYFLPTEEILKNRNTELPHLKTIYQDPIFRLCIAENNDSCIREYIELQILRSYGYNYTLEPTFGKIPELPERNRQAITFLFSSDENSNQYKPVYFTLYYWKR